MNALLIIAMLGCGVLAVIGVFGLNDEIEKWEDEKHEHDRRP